MAAADQTRVGRCRSGASQRADSQTTVLLPSSSISLTSAPMLGLGLDINCIFPYSGGKSVSTGVALELPTGEWSLTHLPGRAHVQT